MNNSPKITWIAICSLCMTASAFAAQAVGSSSLLTDTQKNQILKNNSGNGVNNLQIYKVKSIPPDGEPLPDGAKQNTIEVTLAYQKPHSKQYSGVVCTGTPETIVQACKIRPTNTAS